MSSALRPASVMLANASATPSSTASAWRPCSVMGDWASTKALNSARLPGTALMPTPDSA